MPHHLITPDASDGDEWTWAEACVDMQRGMSGRAPRHASTCTQPYSVSAQSLHTTLGAPHQFALQERKRERGAQRNGWRGGWREERGGWRVERGGWTVSGLQRGDERARGEEEVGEVYGGREEPPHVAPEVHHIPVHPPPRTRL